MILDDLPAPINQLQFECKNQISLKIRNKVILHRRETYLLPTENWIKFSRAYLVVISNSMLESTLWQRETFLVDMESHLYTKLNEKMATVNGYNEKRNKASIALE